MKQQELSRKNRYFIRYIQSQLSQNQLMLWQSQNSNTSRLYDLKSFKNFEIALYLQCTEKVELQIIASITLLNLIIFAIVNINFRGFRWSVETYSFYSKLRFMQKNTNNSEKSTTVPQNIDNRTQKKYQQQKTKKKESKGKGCCTQYIYFSSDQNYQNQKYNKYKTNQYQQFAQEKRLSSKPDA